MCLGPILVKKAGDRLKDGSPVLENIYAGCGKCPECKLRRINDWVFRMQKEMENSKTGYFITLTYDTRSVPITTNNMMTLKKKDLQEFMYRLKAINPELKYYGVGEYGSQTMRPHYHAIVFNVLQKADIYRCWINHESETPYGSIDVGTVTPESIAYTAKYIDKEKRIPLHKNDLRQKEFSIMSKGIGSKYLEKKGVAEYHSDHINNSHYTYNGVKRPLPRYFRQKLYSEEQQIELKLFTQDALDADYKKRENEFYKKYPKGNFEQHEANRKQAILDRHRSKTKARTKI